MRETVNECAGCIDAEGIICRAPIETLVLRRSITGTCYGQTLMQVECAYCGVDMGTKDGHGSTGITSGICLDCIKKEMEKFNARLREEKP